MSTTTQEQTNSDDIQPEIHISYKLVILGEVAVGKSSIAQRFVNGKFTNLHNPTVGALFLTKKIQVNDKYIKYDIWDTAGQGRYHSLTPMYYKNARAAVVVFDVTSSSSFERAQKWMTELFEKATPGIVIALCGNKIDLENRQVSKEEAEEYANKVGCLYMEVSAKTNENIDELFNQIGSRLPMIEEEKPIVLIDDNNENKENEKRCYGYCGY